MEFKIILRILLRRWWLVALLWVVTVLCTAGFTYFQPRIFSAATTYVVSPSSDILNGSGFLSGLSVLGGQPTVANTYASIATSSSIKQSAGEALGLTPLQMNTLVVTSRVQTGTNVIEISVEGRDPLLVQAFTIKVGEKTTEYVEKLKGVFILELLDSAIAPEAPIKPNLKLNIFLGAAAGLILGLGVAFLTGWNEY